MENKLKLRTVTPEDAPLLVQYLNDPKVTRFLSSNIPTPYTLEDANWWIHTGIREQGLVRAVEFKGQFCGIIGLYQQQKEYAHSAELGYWIATEFWNQGIGTEAVQQFCEYVFSNLHIERLYNPVTSLNLASMKVLKKSGFNLEGVMKKAVCHEGKLVDEYLFAKVKT